MMTSPIQILEALLSQNRPVLQTRKGLIIIGLQNDFVRSDGKLPVSIPETFWPALKTLILLFRELDEVVWVRSEFDVTRSQPAIIGSSGKVECDAGVADDVPRECEEDDEDDEEQHEADSPVPSKRRRTSNDDRESTPTLDAIARVATSDALSSETHHDASPASTSSSMMVDEELFFFQTTNREPCCLRDSYGAEICAEAKALLHTDRDIEITTSSYSAFESGSLLMKLRSKLVTELFICGCPTNSSVYATAMEAAQNGFEITLIEDCLAATTEHLNDAAIDQLCDLLEADAMTAAETLEIVRNPESRERRYHYSDEEYEDDQDDEEGDVDDAGKYQKVLESDVENTSLGLRGGGESVISDHISSAFAESIRNATEHWSTEVVSMDPQRPDLDNYFQRLHFSTASAEDGDFSANITRCYKSSSVRSRPAPLNASTKHPGSDERQSAPLSVNSRSTAVDNDNITVQHSPELQSTSAPAGLPSRESIAETNVHRSTRKIWQSTQTPVATSKPQGSHSITSLCRLSHKSEEPDEDSMQQIRSQGPRPLFGQGKEIESKESTISYDLLPSEVAETIFDSLKGEISWQRMYHQAGEVPRLVCCQGSIAEDSSTPVYRHPSDQTLPSEAWTPMVNLVRKAAEEEVGHPLNHALIQFYRSVTDYISEHSDKTLDITKGTSIVNVSFGAQRTMRFRTKRVRGCDSTQPPAERTAFRVPMPHNSMIKMTLETNAEYLHGINPDKRPAVELNPSQTAYEGGRISLTFRNIGTFVTANSARIWGQGAIGKTCDSACPVSNGVEAESERLIRAFGMENQATSLQWDAIYGAGSNVLHLRALSMADSRAECDERIDTKCRHVPSIRAHVN